MNLIKIINLTNACIYYILLSVNVKYVFERNIKMQVITFIYNLLWGDLFTIPLPGGGTIGISLLILLLIPAGIFFTVRTRFLPIRMFPEMCRLVVEKKSGSKTGAISGLQALIVSTATRVGMGNLVGVVAAISAGGAGAVFWMWITAIIGSATAVVESTLAQIYKEKDPLYGGYRGGPAYYIHSFFKGKKNKSVIAVLFAISGLICWCGVSQVISNSVTSSLQGAFNIPPIATTIVLVAISAIIILRKNATVKVLDVIVPIMAVFFFGLTVFVIINNITLLPEVIKNIFKDAFGLRPAAAGLVGAALTKGIQRGLFSNEAGSGSAPCAAAAADVDHPVKSGLMQALGVFIDTLVICTCTAMVMLLAPADVIAGQEGMGLLQAAMHHHFGQAGVVFIAVVLCLFCLSTFIGILFYARSNVSYLFGDKMWAQTGYKIVALIMLFIGGLAAYTFVWDIGDIGVGLMTVFNIIALYPMSGQAIKSLRDYEKRLKERKAEQKLKKN